MIKVNKTRLTRICQGDIYRDIDFIEYIKEKNGVIEISKIRYPFVIVLSQDCERKQDFDFRKGRSSKEIQNKMLLSVLVAPLYNADHVFNGEHLSELGIVEISKIPKNRSKGLALMQNDVPRYHYLDLPIEIPISASIIDFKHYFSVNVEYLRKLKRYNYTCKVSPLYREDISQRFANYLARIGLPENINCKPS